MIGKLSFLDSLLYSQIARPKADKQTTEVTQANPCKKVPIGGNYIIIVEPSQQWTNRTAHLLNTFHSAVALFGIF